MRARYQARFGFICTRYQGGVWYYELLEMARRALLASTGIFVQRGSYAQLFAKLMTSFFFLLILTYLSPFSSPKLEQLMLVSHACILATVFFALATKIGFFAEEGVSDETMDNALIAIMLTPPVMALILLCSVLYGTYEKEFTHMARRLSIQF